MTWTSHARPRLGRARPPRRDHDRRRRRPPRARRDGCGAARSCRVGRAHVGGGCHSPLPPLTPVIKAPAVHRRRHTDGSAVVDRAASRGGGGGGGGPRHAGRGGPSAAAGGARALLGVVAAGAAAAVWSAGIGPTERRRWRCRGGVRRVGQGGPTAAGVAVPRLLTAGRRRSDWGAQLAGVPLCPRPGLRLVWPAPRPRPCVAADIPGGDPWAGDASAASCAAAAPSSRPTSTLPDGVPCTRANVIPATDDTTTNARTARLATDHPRSRQIGRCRGAVHAPTSGPHRHGDGGLSQLCIPCDARAWDWTCVAKWAGELPRLPAQPVARPHSSACAPACLADKVACENASTGWERM